MRQRITKKISTWCSSSRGKNNNIRCLADENIKKKVISSDERMQMLKDELKSTVSRAKYAIKNVNGERKIYIITAKGHFGEGVLC